MPGHYQTFPWVLGDANLLEVSNGCALHRTDGIVSLRMRALGTKSLSMRGFVCFATPGHCVMRSIWYFSARVYKVYAMSMPLCFRTCV